MASARTGAALEIRKIRKKLRQIENLENLERDLTDDELNKILRKKHLRENLLKLIAEHGEEESFTSSFRSDITEDEVPSSSSNNDRNFGYQDNINNSSLGNRVEGEVTFIEPEDETNTDLIDVDIIDEEDVQVLNKTTDATTGQTIEKADNNSDTKSTKHNADDSKKSENNTSKEKTSPKKRKKAAKKETDTTAVPEEMTEMKKTLQKWRFGRFEVIELEGHSDLITDVDTAGDLMVTSSRDTTVKLWSLGTLSELRNYGGHTSTVTCVQLLSQRDSQDVCKLLEIDSSERLFISGSYDCSFKIWAAEKSGQAIKSVYTFNPVTKLVYHPVAQVIISASDGGKMELWDVASGENIHNVRPYDDAVTGLKVVDEKIYSSSSEGLVAVYTIQDRKLVCLFKSENVRSVSNGHLTQRCIRGFDVYNGLIYYGDDGTNIKVLDWKKGLVRKIINHFEDFGVTDSICFHGNLMVSSAYSIDNGMGYVNVRYNTDDTYITTLDDEESGRILSVRCAESGDMETVITAGMKLKVWFLHPRSSSVDDEEMVKPQYIPKLAQRNCRDSDDESDLDSSGPEDEEDEYHSQRQSRNSVDSSQGKGWLGWCSVI